MYVCGAHVAYDATLVLFFGFYRRFLPPSTPPTALSGGLITDPHDTCATSFSCHAAPSCSNACMRLYACASRRKYKTTQATTI